ncbi:LysE family translocator [Celerinatantimonas sp. MCCC 1A17872]|uniref:LysE family translocator n=1 Tax=Celerinatantimonas sp. MCCC 1A17872 TaxID=3177514 RepID=UPI0038CB83F4
MDLQAFIPFILFSFFASVTPGPANLAIFSQSCNSKWNHMLLFGLGISVGFAIVLFVGAIIYLSGAKQSEDLSYILKFIGSLYFLYLGVMLYRSKINSVDQGAQLKSFLKGLFIHPLSYKAWLFVVLAYSSFIPPSLQNNILYFAEIFLVSSIVAMLPWMIGGFVIGKKLNARHLVAVNRLSGVALIGLVVYIWLI